MEKKLKELKCIVKNRLFYLKRIEKLSCIATKNLMNFDKFAVGNISDHWEGLSCFVKETQIKKHYIEGINQSFRGVNRSMIPKHRDKNGKFSFQLSIDFYEILFGVQIIEIRNFLKEAVNTKFIHKDRKTMEVDSLEDTIRQRPILNNIEIDKFLSQLEDTIRKNYNNCHRIMMLNFINNNPLGHIPFHLHSLYKKKDPEEKQELPSIKNINIDETKILSECLQVASEHL